MNSFLCSITAGRYGCPDVRVGQFWIYDNNVAMLNPFVEVSMEDAFRVIDVKDGWVKYTRGVDGLVTFHAPIPEFRNIRTLIDESYFSEGEG